MRPSSASSTSDPNAPYRDAIASLSDCNFLTEDDAANASATDAPRTRAPLEELNPRQRTHHAGPSTTTDVGPSATAQVTIATLRQFITNKGHRRSHLLRDKTIHERLNGANLSARTFLAALEIIHDPHHALLTALAVTETERQTLITRFVEIMNNSLGFNASTRALALSASDDATQLVSRFVAYLRH